VEDDQTSAPGGRGDHQIRESARGAVPGRRACVAAPRPQPSLRFFRHADLWHAGTCGAAGTEGPGRASATAPGTSWRTPDADRAEQLTLFLSHGTQ